MNNKIILCLLIALALWFIASCKNTEASKNPNDNEEIIIENLYFFRTSHGGNFNAGYAGNVKGPVKINPVSKTASYICIDPLCDHIKDCPLFDSSGFYVAGNYLFFTKGGVGISVQTGDKIGGPVDFCVYDMLKGSVRKLAEYWDNMQILNRAGNYLYYSMYDVLQYEKDGQVDYIIYRADAKTGNIIIIDRYLLNNDVTKAWGEYPELFMIIDNKIYWRNFEYEENKFFIYTTNLDGKDKKTIDITGNQNKFINSKYNNGYFYQLEIKIKIEEILELSGYERERAVRDLNLYRISFNSEKSKDSEIIAEHIMFFVPHGDKIYYTVLEDNPELIEYNGEQTYNWSGGKVYIMNIDGKDKRLLCETGYNLNDGFMDARTIDGVDYLAFAFNSVWENSFSDSGYSYGLSTDTLIINASTGEYTVVSVPE